MSDVSETMPTIAEPLVATAPEQPLTAAPPATSAEPEADSDSDSEYEPDAVALATVAAHCDATFNQ